jgi:hypothetical protein
MCKQKLRSEVPEAETRFTRNTLHQNSKINERDILNKGQTFWLRHSFNANRRSRAGGTCVAIKPRFYCT